MAFDLKSISRNSAKPPRIIIYGPAGIGKTTFGCCAPNPIVIQTEDGLGEIDAEAFPLATSYDDVMSAIYTLKTEEHGYQTLVVDSLDWLEPLVWKAVCERLKVASIEAPGYGKGYVEASREWRDFFAALTDLRDSRGMTIIMTAHSAVVHIEDPVHPAYDSHDLKLHKRATGIASEFSDVIGFCSMKTMLTTESAGFGEKRNRAITTGERIIHLVGSPAYTAKNRYGMPDVCPLDWTEFSNYLPKTKKD